MRLAGHEVGAGRPLFLIAGPCVIEGAALTQEIAGRLKEIDRKSTRLNSSHDQISYAVFCLKKKKKNNILRKEPHTSPAAGPGDGRHTTAWYSPQHSFCTSARDTVMSVRGLPDAQTHHRED